MSAAPFLYKELQKCTMIFKNFKKVKELAHRDLINSFDFFNVTIGVLLVISVDPVTGNFVVIWEHDLSKKKK